MISLRKNGVLVNVGTFTLKQILLYNRPHSECHSKNLRLLLIGSIRKYPIQFEAFEPDFVDKDWCHGPFWYCTFKPYL